RGARGGEPRHADRPEQRTAGPRLDPCELRTGRGDEAVYVAVAGRGERLQSFRRADGGQLDRPGRAPRHVLRRPAPGAEIVGLSGRVEDEVIEVSDVFSLQGDRLARGDG